MAKAIGARKVAPSTHVSRIGVTRDGRMIGLDGILGDIEERLALLESFVLPEPVPEPKTEAKDKKSNKKPEKPADTEEPAAGATTEPSNE